MCFLLLLPVAKKRKMCTKYHKIRLMRYIWCKKKKQKQNIDLIFSVCRNHFSELSYGGKKKIFKIVFTSLKSCHLPFISFLVFSENGQPWVVIALPRPFSWTLYLLNRLAFLSATPTAILSVYLGDVFTRALLSLSEKFSRYVVVFLCSWRGRWSLCWGWPGAFRGTVTGGRSPCRNFPLPKI